MRAGCFAETRVINLLNRRFVTFYYNTDNGAPSRDVGKDPAAKLFTQGKTKNKWAFFAAFNAEGEPLGVTDVYADKDSTFDLLVAILREHPDYDRFTREEEATLAKAKAEPMNGAALVEAGRLMEDLGRYKEANAFFQATLQAGNDPVAVAESHRGLLRLARFTRDWKAQEERLRLIEANDAVADTKLGLGPDVAMERAYRLLADKNYEEARQSLEAAIKKFPTSNRRSEFHFSAGVANFFLRDKDRAYYHWCYVVENLPDDRLARRCYTAAAHEGMPYENPELGGYRAPLPGGNIQIIQRAYDRARQVYEKQKARQ